MKQRHLADFSTFAMNCESASGPVDIIELETFYFAGAQPKARQQQ